MRSASRSPYRYVETLLDALVEDDIPLRGGFVADLVASAISDGASIRVAIEALTIRE